jgi:hypothetical protein
VRPTCDFRAIKWGNPHGALTAVVAAAIEDLVTATIGTHKLSRAGSMSSSTRSRSGTGGYEAAEWFRALRERINHRSCAVRD